MAVPEFVEISVRGARSGDVFVYVGDKFLGTLHQRDGRFVVDLSSGVVKSIGRPPSEIVAPSPVGG